MTSLHKIKILLTALIVSLFSFQPLFAITAEEIIKKSEAAIQGNTQAAIIEMTVKTRRWTRTIEMKSYTIRKEKKSFVEIIAPVKDADNRFLLIDQQMWHYVPKLQQTIKISPSMMLQSWMGSDFSNDDIVKESSIVNDYTHHLIGRETVDGHECYKLELIPKPDTAVVWGKILYYARTNDYLPVQEEFYNEHDVLKKRLTNSNFKQMHDRVIPTEYKMETLKKKDRYTLMVLKAAKFDIKIPNRIFTLQNLKRK